LTPRGSQNEGAIPDVEPACLHILPVLSKYVFKLLRCRQNQYDCDDNTYTFHVEPPSPQSWLHPIVITKPVAYCYSPSAMNPLCKAELRPCSEHEKRVCYRVISKVQEQSSMLDLPVSTSSLYWTSMPSNLFNALSFPSPGYHAV